MSFTTRRLSREERPSRWKKFAQTAAPVVMKFGGLFILLYEKWKLRREEEDRHTARVHVLKKFLVILIATLLALVLLAGTVQALVGMRILTLNSFFSAAGSDLPTDENGFTNILLLGAGDKDHDGIDLTDAVMIASIDPDRTQSAVLLSLPRDLYLLQTEAMGRGRVNELYRNTKYALRRKEGMTDAVASPLALQALADEISRHLKLPIHKVVKIDFTAFVQVVDALGGVDLDVPYDIIDPEYPGPNYTFEPFEIRKGPQHLDGETALKYARSRHTTSDFGRAARQQQLLGALAEKAKSEGLLSSPGKITALFKILTDHVETTMKFSEIIGAAAMGKKINRDRIISMTLGIANGYDTPFIEAGGFLYTPPRDQFAGASVLLPVSFPSFPITWKQIQTFMDLLIHHRGVYVAKPSVSILNAGAKTGMGRKLANELIRYGFNVNEVDNATEDRRNSLKIPSTVIAAKTPEDKDATAFFASLLKLTTGPLPSGIDPLKQDQITIVLGEDYAYAPLQDLVPSLDE